MKVLLSRWLLRVSVSAVLMFLSVSGLEADTIRMRDGVEHQGIIQEISNGEVRVQINPESALRPEIVTFDIRDIDTMNFDTPHLLSSGADPALDHFLSDIEAQEVVESFAELNAAAEELERSIDQVRNYWEAKEPIQRSEVQAWEAARDAFRRPLSRYQEILNDLYFHVLARVDEYNGIARDAEDIYVGVEGLFDVGSPLLPSGMGELSWRRYVPVSWYDTIYYEGYSIGYDEAYEKFNSRND